VSIATINHHRQGEDPFTDSPLSDDPNKGENETGENVLQQTVNLKRGKDGTLRRALDFHKGTFASERIGRVLVLEDFRRHKVARLFLIVFDFLDERFMSAD